MKKCMLLGLLVLASGCFTPSHINSLRARQRPPILNMTAKDNTMYAGVDILGVKEALAVDPAGTSFALTKDGIVAVVTGLATAYVADQVKDDGDDKKASPTVDIPQIQADTVIYNAGNGSINYNQDSGNR